ncbi:DUF4062 domain-containing protein [Nocardioides alcanivorans]|uniref:DUF4062 domain-containing protein n=1 Tax=Nocardioides alcanivorans TaxID=2897352 RepID=UPI001F349283|nr:DUF4062 domain-containing protein [Nocardioides alcanivorans]
MERREQVIISSTYIDLVDERQEVIQTLLEADCIPAGMELFPASDDDRWALIARRPSRQEPHPNSQDAPR